MCNLHVMDLIGNKTTREKTCTIYMRNSHLVCGLRSIKQLIATNSCLEIAGTVEPCEGKALVISSDDQSACIIKRRSKCLYYQAMIKVLVLSSDDQSACIKRRCLHDQFLT